MTARPVLPDHPLYAAHGAACAHDEIDLRPGPTVRALPVWNLAWQTGTTPVGPADALLFAFVADRHVAIEPPTDEHPVWDVRVRAAGGWLLATAPDLPSALLALWKRYVAAGVVG